MCPTASTRSRFSPINKLDAYLQAVTRFFPHYPLKVISDMESSFMSWWHVRIERDTDFRTFTYQCDQIQHDMKEAQEAQKKAEAQAKRAARR